MSKKLTVIAGNQVFLNAKQQEPMKATIEVDLPTGKVIKIHSGVVLGRDQFDEGQVQYIDAGNFIVMPGVVDAHVHVNEPGRTVWEGFETATIAAAHGGCTTLIDMPLNSIPPTTTVQHLEVKRKAALTQCYIDVGFYGGVIPDNAAELKPLVRAGVRGFKCFMIESGVDEFPCVNEEQIRLALEQLKGEHSFLMFHAELASEEPHCSSHGSAPSEYDTFLHSRPGSMEDAAIEMVIRLCRQYKVPCHIVHLSSASALPLLKKAKQEGLPLTVETTFHYLFFGAEDIPKGATQFKCCPPIREHRNREALWQGLLDGTIDYVISDHSPCVAELKRMETGDFMAAWGGIASVQFGLPIMWTEARKRSLPINKLIEWICSAPAKRIGLEKVKGELCLGGDGDVVIWDPEQQFNVEVDTLKFKNKVSPYVHRTMYGVVAYTVCRGQIVYDQKTGMHGPVGKLI